MTIKLQDQTLRLLHQKAAFWEEGSALLISDLHLGKSEHFRRGGVAIPKDGDRENLRRLKALIDVVRPDTLLLLGDLFHSAENAHVREAGKLFRSYAQLSRKLVVGNHDILDRCIYSDMGLEVYDKSLDAGPFRFVHEPPESRGGGAGKTPYTIAGHIHPGIRFRGRGRQTVTLPCFWFGASGAILPAFGNFTGLYRLRPAAGDRIYAIANREIIFV